MLPSLSICLDLNSLHSHHKWETGSVALAHCFFLNLPFLIWRCLALMAGSHAMNWFPNPTQEIPTQCTFLHLLYLSYYSIQRRDYNIIARLQRNYRYRLLQSRIQLVYHAQGILHHKTPLAAPTAQIALPQCIVTLPPDSTVQWREPKPHVQFHLPSHHLPQVVQSHV